MRQFYEAYRGHEKVSALLRQLSWTHHMIILGQAKPTESREFYILAAIRFSGAFNLIQSRRSGRSTVVAVRDDDRGGIVIHSARFLMPSIHRSR